MISYLADTRETEPVGAVVLHRLRDRHVGVYHPLQDAPDGGAPLLGPGRLLTHDAVRDMTQRLSGSAGARTILPECVLVADTDLLVWWRPATRRPILFETRDKDFDREMSGRAVLHPPLLFVGRPQKLAVYALAKSARPGAGTPLFRAPYFNLYLSGAMCEGNVPLPAAPLPTEDVLAGYEAAFYDSSFAHTNIRGDVVNWPGGHAGFWRAMAASASGFFPAHALLPIHLTGNSLTSNSLTGNSRQPLTLEKVINNNGSQLLIDPSQYSNA